MSEDKCTAVPLAEQLRSVPADAVLRIDSPNALRCMDTRSIPIGRLCHEAADAIDAKAVMGTLTTEQIDTIWHRMGSFYPNDHREFARLVLKAAAGERAP
jgi:hypothetical protein